MALLLEFSSVLQGIHHRSDSVDQSHSQSINHADRIDDNAYQLQRGDKDMLVKCSLFSAWSTEYGAFDSIIRVVRGTPKLSLIPTCQRSTVQTCHAVCQARYPTWITECTEYSYLVFTRWIQAYQYTGLWSTPSSVEYEVGSFSRSIDVNS